MRVKGLLAGAACCLGMASAALAADVGVSIQFSQPGVFGRVDIGQYPQPQVILPQPVLIAPPPGMPPPEPIYLWVPMEHRKHWDRYCGQYHACGHPVYFVNHAWYKEHVLAHRDEGRGGHGRAEEEHGRHEGHEERDHERGHGHD